jgi:hypothetical protein
VTKTVRIENADSGTNVNLTVEVWDKGENGGPDAMVKAHPLTYPTAMKEITITSTRYLVVREGLIPAPPPTT